MNKGFIIDLEGTLVSSGKPLPCSIEFMDYLNKNGDEGIYKPNKVVNNLDEIIKIMDEKAQTST